jgi:hypothetical protein
LPCIIIWLLMCLLIYIMYMSCSELSVSVSADHWSTCRYTLYTSLYPFIAV